MHGQLTLQVPGSPAQAAPTPAGPGSPVVMQRPGWKARALQLADGGVSRSSGRKAGAVTYPPYARTGRVAAPKLQRAPDTVPDSASASSPGAVRARGDGR
jgi:hypothetical protein